MDGRGLAGDFDDMKGFSVCFFIKNTLFQQDK
jgi:hypothetical protein